MDTAEITLKFVDASPAEGDGYAQDLQADLQQLEGIEVKRIREREDTLDFGATLVLILGTTAVTALSRGIASWIQRNSGATIEITDADGNSRKITHLNSRDAVAIAKAISPKH